MPLYLLYFFTHLYTLHLSPHLHVQALWGSQALHINAVVLALLFHISIHSAPHHHICMCRRFGDHRRCTLMLLYLLYFFTHLFTLHLVATSACAGALGITGVCVLYIFPIALNAGWMGLASCLGIMQVWVCRYGLVVSCRWGWGWGCECGYVGVVASSCGCGFGCVDVVACRCGCGCGRGCESVVACGCGCGCRCGCECECGCGDVVA